MIQKLPLVGRVIVPSGPSWRPRLSVSDWANFEPGLGYDAAGPGGPYFVYASYTTVAGQSRTYDYQLFGTPEAADALYNTCVWDGGAIPHPGRNYNFNVRPQLTSVT
jgi:hypothetical protein